MKKVIALLLCTVFCVAIMSGCSGLKGEEKGASIQMYLASYPQTLDPSLVQLNSDTTQILNLIFEPLTLLDEKGNVYGGLAYEWYDKYDERDESFKMFFKLRETMWSDKRSVSADDVIYAWKRILDPSVDSPYASLLAPIQNADKVKSGIMTSDDLGIKAVDDKLLEITFENDYDADLFAETVANIHLAPLREDVIVRYAKEGEDWSASSASMVCNGPFRVQAMEEGNKLVLERNTYYRRDDEAALDKFVVPYRLTCYFYEGKLETAESGKTQFEYQADCFNNGEKYYLSGFSKETFAAFGDKLTTKNTLNGYAFYYNTANQLLSAKETRQALSVALDRTKICEITGTGEKPATGYVPTGVFNTKSGTDFRTTGGDVISATADVNKAKSLISGSKGTLTLAYLIPESHDLILNNRRVNYVNVYQQVAEYAKGVWESLGYTIELRGLNPNDYKAALYAKDFDILGINIINDSASAYTYLAPYTTKYCGTVVSINNTEDAFSTHYTNINDSAYNELIDSITYLSNREERAAKLHEAETMLADLCPVTMLYWYSSSYVASGKISGIGNTIYGGYKTFERLSLKDWRNINASEDALMEESVDK